MKNKKWISKRHLHFKKFLYHLLKGYTKRKYGYSYEEFDTNGRNYLILYNHVTGFDQCLLGYSFKNDLVYYVATEDIFSIPVVSSLIDYFVKPIPFKKSTNDTRAVMNCIKVAKEGGNIALSPEGNRTYSGVTENIKSSISKFVKALKLPIAFFKFEGGYGIKPRWSDKNRKGKMSGKVEEVLEYDDYKDLDNDVLYKLICDKLYNDDVLLNKTYENKERAEYLERVIYVCPKCGLSKFYSKGDVITCMHCGLSAVYESNLKFTSLDSNFEFETVKEWYDYQNDFINNFDLINYKDIIYRDKVKLFKVIVYKRKQKLFNAVLSMYNDRYEFTSNNKSIVLKFDDISATSVLGKNKFNIYNGDTVYQIKSTKRFNACKYVNIYYRYKNIKEDKHEQFLGL